MNTQGLIEYQTIRTIVENVTQAQADVAQAFLLLQGAKERLTAVLGDGQANYYGHIWERDVSDYNLPRTAEKTATFLERNAWRYVLEQTGLRSFMTEARQKELEAQLDKGQFPALTVENVLSTLQGLTSQVGTLLQESALEVFDWLRPSQHSRVGSLKTNTHFRVGDRAIVGGAVDVGAWGGGFRLNVYREANFRALGNVFSLLDGHGAQKYPDDLPTQLRTALQHAKSAQCLVVPPYLECKPYRNGHLHMKFLRRDLVDKLNQIGADGTLPGRD